MKNFKKTFLLLVIMIFIPVCIYSFLQIRSGYNLMVERAVRVADFKEYLYKLDDHVEFLKTSEGQSLFSNDPSQFVQACENKGNGIFIFDKRYLYRSFNFAGERFVSNRSDISDFLLIDLHPKINGNFLGVTPAMAIYEIDSNKHAKLIDLVRKTIQQME